MTEMAKKQIRKSGVSIITGPSSKAEGDLTQFKEIKGGWGARAKKKKHFFLLALLGIGQRVLIFKAQQQK